MSEPGGSGTGRAGGEGPGGLAGGLPAGPEGGPGSGPGAGPGSGPEGGPPAGPAGGLPAGATALGLLLDGRRRPFRAGRAPAGAAAGGAAGFGGERAQAERWEGAAAPPAGAGFTARPIAGLAPAAGARTWQAPGSSRAPVVDAAAADVSRDEPDLSPSPGRGEPQEPAAAGGPGGDAEARLAQARADGFAAGLLAGRQQAEAALGATMGEVAALARALAQARRVDPEALVEPLVEALMACLAAVLEEEPALARASLGPRVAGALARVGEAARPAALMLNPRDMAWARARLAAVLADEGVALAADAAIPPGGFRLRAGAATVEDRIDERLGRLAAEARASLSESLVGAAGTGPPPDEAADAPGDTPAAGASPAASDDARRAA